MTHQIAIVGSTIATPRLRLRAWQPSDAEGAFAIYGSHEVSQWLTPAMARVDTLERMRAVLAKWIADPPRLRGRPVGQWAMEDRASGRIAGSAQILPLPPQGADLELGYQLAPWAWGLGLAAEAGHALAHFAFSNGEEELFAVVRRNNERGARAARRMGMEWAGETEKYYYLRLQVFRLRKADLDNSQLEPAPVER